MAALTPKQEAFASPTSSLSAPPCRTGGAFAGVTVVVASAFQRGWIEDRFAGQIRDVARALIERPWVRFEVQPPRAEGDRANG